MVETTITRGRVQRSEGRAQAHKDRGEEGTRTVATTVIYVCQEFLTCSGAMCDSGECSGTRLTCNPHPQRCHGGCLCRTALMGG